MDYIAQVALKQSMDMFKILFWSLSVEKNNQVHKEPYSAAVGLSIPWGQGVLSEFICVAKYKSQTSIQLTADEVTELKGVYFDLLW